MKRDNVPDARWTGQLFYAGPRCVALSHGESDTTTSATGQANELRHTASVLRARWHQAAAVTTADRPFTLFQVSDSRGVVLLDTFRSWSHVDAAPGRSRTRFIRLFTRAMSSTAGSRRRLPG